MKQAIRYSLLGLLAYLAFTIMQFPASTFLNLVSRQVPDLTVREARGSALRGSADEVWLGNVHFSSVTWRLQPLALFTGRLAYQMSVDEPILKLNGVASIGFSGQLEIEDLNGQFPLGRVLASRERNNVPLAGEVEVKLDELRLRPNGSPQSAQGIVRLNNARSLTDPPIGLGNFIGEIDTGENGIVATVTDDQSPLELSATLTLTPDGSYRFTGQAAVRDKNNQQLRQALEVFGAPRGDGRWQIDLDGALDV